VPSRYFALPAMPPFARLAIPLSATGTGTSATENPSLSNSCIHGTKNGTQPGHHPCLCHVGTDSNRVLGDGSMQMHISIRAGQGRTAGVKGLQDGLDNDGHWHWQWQRARDTADPKARLSSLTASSTQLGPESSLISAPFFSPQAYLSDLSLRAAVELSRRRCQAWP
jgi:hypothetical protein